jgi:hypothetical protein
LLVVGLLSICAIDGANYVIASDTAGETTETPPEEGRELSSDESPPHSPFEQYPAGDGAIQFEELSPPEQSAIMTAAERTDYGHEVHARWSRVARARAAEAKRIKAAYQSGTQGLDEVGVD